MRRILISLPLLAMVAVMLGGLLYPLAQAQRLFGPPDASLGWFQRWRLSLNLVLRAETLQRPVVFPQREATVYIPPGASANEIAGTLWEQGLLADPAAFLAYLIYTGADRRLQQGTYRLQGPLSAAQVAAQLQNPAARLITVQTLPGWRREEVAALLETGGLFSAGDFLTATAHASDYPLPFPAPPDATLEGFLFPGTYTLAPDDIPSDLVRAMVARLAQVVTPALQQGFAAQGLTPYQALILASIVQREAMVEDEMPLIASVYLNRLHRGMRLEADPTVQYALGRSGQWWKSPLATSDLQVDSPYNTYRHPGLPPAPIANPGEAALRAVAFPASTPYLFFRAACDGGGRHVFSETFDEHVRQQCP